ncbi:MAG: hypothetical protein K2O18_10370 [Oscillospiraceae bacterium]|nr:hypothetical protein [Oscillospiraceae bacterium]
MGKQFKDAAATAQPVYNTLIGSAQDTQQEHEVYNTQDTPSTQGRKGAKLPRINMAFSPQNLEYLRIMSGIRGISITKYVNALIEQDREQNAETYEAAKRLTSDRTIQDI